VNLLAIDTAGRACSVALETNGRVIERIETRARMHAATVLPMAEACLDEAGLSLAGLDGIAFGQGPGSFTGLRIAASVTQGLAFGADLPVAPVSSLAAVAAAARRAHGWERVLVANDARMDEVYAGAYDTGPDGLPEVVMADALLTPSALVVPGGGGWSGAGTAFSAWPELAGRLGLAVCDPGLEPTARDLLGLARAVLERGEGVAAWEAVPVYLREKVAWKTGG
jgi:tRNA threonylcarbamoyladenosine biosynthesis protein TsaB